MQFHAKYYPLIRDLRLSDHPNGHTIFLAAVQESVLPYTDHDRSLLKNPGAHGLHLGLLVADEATAVYLPRGHVEIRSQPSLIILPPSSELVRCQDDVALL